jgi:hypothetical protein
MSALHNDDMALLVSSIEHLVAYDRVSNKLYNIVKFFKKITTLIQEDMLYEEVNDIKAKTKKMYGEECVDELDTSMKKRLDNDIDIQGMDITSFTCMWFTVALAFVCHPVDNYMDIYGHQCIHPGLFNMANDETVSLVNRLSNDIQTLVDKNMADQLG